MIWNKVVCVSSATVSLDRPLAGLAFLAGACEEAGVDYDVFDLNLFLRNTYGMKVWNDMGSASLHLSFQTHDQTLLKTMHEACDLAAQKVIDMKPDLVAITSLSNYQIAWAYEFLKAFNKKNKNNIKVIAGGPGISFEQEYGKTAGKILAEQGLVDYYVLGEGDKNFPDFLRNGPGPEINEGTKPLDKWAEQLDDLSDIPVPSYKKMDMLEYNPDQSYSSIRNVVLGITGSRGCVRRCTFCDIGHIWKKFRFRPAESIIHEILKHHNDTGCLDYYFTDSLINGSLKQFNDYLDMMIELKKEEKFKDLHWTAQFIVRPSKFHKEELFKKMRDSGCDHLQVGIESGSESVREHMGKKFSNEDIDYHFEMSSKYKIKNFVLFFTAYPTETLKDHEDSLEFFKKNQKYLLDKTIIGTTLSSPAVFYRNSPLHDMKDSMGIELHGDEYENVSNWSIISNPDLTVKERYRRYLEIEKLVSDLRYPRSESLLQYMEWVIQDVIQYNKKEKSKVLPIKLLN